MSGLLPEPRIVVRRDRVVIVLPLTDGFRAMPYAEQSRAIEQALSRVNDRLQHRLLIALDTPAALAEVAGPRRG